MGDTPAFLIAFAGLTFLPALLLAAVLTPLARRVALAAELVAPVRADRLHREVRPYGGGMAIAASLALVAGLVYALTQMGVILGGEAHAGFVREAMERLPRIGAGAILFFVIGLLDDRYALAAVPKLLLQFLAATVVVLGFGVKATVWLELPHGADVLSIVWVVAIVNAYNLFDHADGLAAAAGAVALAVLGAGQLWMGGGGLASAAALATAGALAGFLLYNYPPSKLFMGDAGSALVGYLLAALTMEAQYYFPGQSASRFVVFIPLAILAVPLFDMVCVIAGRVAAWKNPMIGDASSHLAHRMLARGVSPRRVVLFAAGVSAVTGAASVAMYTLSDMGLVAAWGVVAAAMVAMLVARHRPAPAEVRPKEGLSPESLARGLRRTIIVLAAVGLLVLPQFTTNAGFIGIRGIPGPMTVLVIGLVLWMMPMLLVASWVAEGRARLAQPWLAVPAILFVAGAAISTAMADDKASAIVRAAEVAGLWAAMFALAQAIRTDGERRFLLTTLLAIALAMALVAIYQAAIGMQMTWDYFQANREEVLRQHSIVPGSWMEKAFLARFTGGVQASLGHPNVLAALLVLGTLVGCGLAKEKWSEVGMRGSRQLAVVILAVAIVCAIGVFLTQSRGGVGALAVGLYWLAVAWRVRRRGVRIALYLAPLAAAAVALPVAVAVDHPTINEALKTLRYRLDYWQATAEILRERWLAGVGLENFGLHYVQHKLAWAPEDVRDPHNIVLSVWSQLGLAGLAALAGLLAIAVVRWRRAADGAAGEELPGATAGAVSGRVPVSGPRLDKPAVPRPGQGLAGLLIPVWVVALPLIIWYFPLEWYLAVLATAVMALMMGVASTDDPSRILVSCRPMRALRAGCIVAVLAFLLMEQIGTAIAEPPTAWAFLVVVVVSIGATDGLRPAAGGQAEAAGKPGGVAVGSPLKFLLVVLIMAGVVAYSKWLIYPVGREQAFFRLAGWTDDVFQRDEALKAAGEANPLAWEPAMIRGRNWQESAGRKGEGPGEDICLQQALPAFREAVERQPRLRRAYLLMAECRLTPEGAMEDPSALLSALECLDKARELYPTDIPTQLWLADVVDRMGDDARAIREYRRLLELDRQMAEETRRLSQDKREAVEQRLRELEGSGKLPAGS